MATRVASVGLKPWPAGTRDWLTRKMQSEDEDFDFDDWIRDIDSWEVISRGVHFPCMDNLLDGSEILRQMRQLHNLPVQTQSKSQRYGYMLQSPGGNHTALYPKTIKTLVRKGLKSRVRFNKTHAFFYVHTGCTAKEAETWATPEEGVRWYVSLYKAHEILFPGMFVGRPQLHIAQIETHTSTVTENREVDPKIWEVVDPFVLTDESLRAFIKGQNLDMYLPESNTLRIAL